MNHSRRILLRGLRAMRVRHIEETFRLYGWWPAMSDFFAYLGEAIGQDQV